MEDFGNTAFIDGQNLHFGTKMEQWSIDYCRFRQYLSDKYGVVEAYYYLGFITDGVGDLYSDLQKAGFILVFREHSAALKGKKKGNVDCDVVFDIMRKLLEKNLTGNVVLVSGDGDYKRTVDFLVARKRFKKILFPNRAFASSLYKSLGGEYFAYLDDAKQKIQLKPQKKKAP